MEKELSAQDILEMDDLVIEPHPVKEWKNRVVHVRSVTAQERGEIEASAAQYKEAKGKNDSFARDFTVKFAWLTMCDSTGKRLFEKIEDVSKLKLKNAAAIASIAEHGQRLSGFSKEDMDQLEKKSETAQPGASPTV